MRDNIIIIGGGASGLMAAITAARHNKTAGIIILERKDRVGKKLLATGNGCCNLTNVGLSSSNYYGNHVERAMPVVEKFSPKHVIEFFHSLGVMCRVEGDGRVYPYSYQASSVLDALRFEIARYDNVEVRENFDAEHITRSRSSFTVMAKSGERVTGNKLILAAGGCASPGLGSNGSGFSLLQAMGHSVTPVSPALVQLRTDVSFVKGLNGIKIVAGFSIQREGCCLFANKGEVLFTEYGLSGPPVFQGSHLVHFYKGLVCVLDCMPDYSEAELREILQERKKMLAHLTMENFFTGMLNKKLGQAIAKCAGVEKLSLSVERLPAVIIDRTAHLIKNLELAVTGTQGWGNAQVTAGGGDLQGFNMHNMESATVKGLYAAGEILDIFGDCGGYNLQWAWASGYLAGKSAAEGVS